jgi:hypothetical protein
MVRGAGQKATKAVSRKTLRPALKESSWYLRTVAGSIKTIGDLAQAASTLGKRQPHPSSLLP